jgi:hypothetical protein
MSWQVAEAFIQIDWLWDEAVLAEANIVTVDADQALAYNRLFLTPSALQAVEDCFRILETFKALKVVVLACNPLVKTFLTQV